MLAVNSMAATSVPGALSSVLAAGSSTARSSWILASACSRRSRFVVCEQRMKTHTVYVQGAMAARYKSVFFHNTNDSKRVAIALLGSEEEEGQPPAAADAGSSSGVETWFTLHRGAQSMVTNQTYALYIQIGRHRNTACFSPCFTFPRQAPDALRKLTQRCHLHAAAHVAM
jgi:hypothetical protein